MYILMLFPEISAISVSSSSFLNWAAFREGGRGVKWVCKIKTSHNENKNFTRRLRHTSLRSYRALGKLLFFFSTTNLDILFLLVESKWGIIEQNKYQCIL